MSRRLRIISQSAAVVTIALLAAPLAAQDVDPLQTPDTQLEPINWSDIDGWADDDHAAAFGTFRISCNPFLAARTNRDSRPIHRALSAGAPPPPARSPTTRPRRVISSSRISAPCASPSWAKRPAC
jgi:hypothetical protein